MELLPIFNEHFTQEHTYVDCVKDQNGCKNVDEYVVVRANDDRILAAINFQHGPVKETGNVNGIFNEDLLLMIIDRLETWQKTKFACPENAEALNHLYDAVKVLRFRTERRRAEGTLGTHQTATERNAEKVEHVSYDYPEDHDVILK